MLLNDVHTARQKVSGKLRTGATGDGRTHDNTGNIRHLGYLLRRGIQRNTKGMSQLPRSRASLCQQANQFQPFPGPHKGIKVHFAKFGAHNQYALFWDGRLHHNVFSGCVEVAPSQRLMCRAQA